MSHFFGTSRPAPIDGRLRLISEVASVKQWVRRHVAEVLMVPNSRRLMLNRLYPQVVFQRQLQILRIDLGPDHSQRRPRQRRYAELSELQSSCKS